MKKTISILLVLILALSCFTVQGMTAAAAEKAEPAYLLGDADMDGDISILDATEIQRALASLTTMSSLQAALSDLYGDGMSILCATEIQRCLAGFDSEVPIGEPAGDENEGVIYSEMVPSYGGMGDMIISAEDQLFFSTAYPGVAFVSDNALMLNYCEVYGYPADEMQFSADGEIHWYNLPNGSIVIFDHDEMQMVFSDYSTTVTTNGAVPFNPFGSSFARTFTLNPDVPSTLYEIQDTSRYFGADPCIATFAYDEVPMLKSGDDILVPLQVLSDFFFSPKGSFVQYNGKGVYSLSNQAAASTPALWEQYVSETEKVESVNPAMAQVNYYELCNVLEARYGLRAAHNIDNFDSYFRRRGLRDDFLSGNLERIETAQQKMAILLFEDFHTSANVSSPYFDGTVTPSLSMVSPTYYTRTKNFEAIEKQRAAVLGEEVTPYERCGDTVFITFDSFNIDSIAMLYSEGFEPDPCSGDTIELFAYALRRLQNEDSDVKNVVVDIARNGGGTTISCGYVIDALIGNCVICLNNPNTNALSQTVVKYDLNLDGVIDENDISIKGMGKNISLVMSNASFSCGNLLPCSLKALDNSVLLLGQTSGGGACEVGYISTMLGSVMQISSEMMMVTMKNGYIRDIDGGVDPDIPLSTNRLFDRDYIVDLVNEYFG